MNLILTNTISRVHWINFKVFSTLACEWTLRVLTNILTIVRCFTLVYVWGTKSLKYYYSLKTKGRAEAPFRCWISIFNAYNMHDQLHLASTVCDRSLSLYTNICMLTTAIPHVIVQPVSDHTLANKRPGTVSTHHLTIIRILVTLVDIWENRMSYSVYRQEILHPIHFQYWIMII